MILLQERSYAALEVLLLAVAAGFALKNKDECKLQDHCCLKK